VDHFTQTDGDAASSRLVSDTVSIFGLRSLTGGYKAFINFTRQGLLQGLASLLPPGHSAGTWASGRTHSTCS
jgi:EAL and modified HD-GYP domain-containing signal transduction protein